MPNGYSKFIKIYFKKLKKINYTIFIGSLKVNASSVI